MQCCCMCSYLFGVEALQVAAAVLACVALCVGLSWKLVQFVLGCWTAHKQYVASPIPGPTPASSIIGHVPQILGPKNAWVLSSWAQQYGRLYKLHVLDHFMLVLTDPDSIVQITRRGGHLPYIPKARVVYQALEVAVKPKQRNIVTTEDGDYWKAIRTATAPCFSWSNLKKVVPLVVELTGRVADHIAAQPDQLVDVSDCARRITSDVMGVMLLGEDLGGTRWQDCPYLEIFYHVLKAQAVLVTSPLYLWQLWRADARHARRCFEQHNTMMDQKVAALLKLQPPNYTIAAHLLRVIDPTTGQLLHPNKLKAEVAAFMAAGHETTSHAITWCLATLAVHPDIQQEVFEELLAAGLAPGGSSSQDQAPFKPSDLGSLPLLTAVIKEALRLLPPTPLGGVRVCTEDNVQLCGFKVPKGTLVNIPSLPLALAHHTFGPGALLFQPHRWLHSSGMQQGAAVASSASAQASSQQQPLPDPLTFSTGVRGCLGQNLAKLELQVVLATLLSRFRFSPGPELQAAVEVAQHTGLSPIAAVYDCAEVHVTLQPAGGQMLLRVEQR